MACGCGVRRRVAAAKASARQGQRGHEPGRLLSLAATLMLLARRSTEDPPERREAVQRPRAGLLLRAPHHSSRRMALRYFTLSLSLCAETIGGAWEVRLEQNMERVRAMIGISFYLYEMGSARAPKGFPWWTAGMKIDPRVITSVKFCTKGWCKISGWDFPMLDSRIGGGGIWDQVNPQKYFDFFGDFFRKNLSFPLKNQSFI